MNLNFSPPTSPDKRDVFLPLPHGGRRSPRSRLYAFLAKNLATIGTEGYTDDSNSEDELNDLLESHGKTFCTASHAEKADVIVQMCIDQCWRDKADEYDLKQKSTSDFAAMLPGRVLANSLCLVLHMVSAP